MNLGARLSRGLQVHVADQNACKTSTRAMDSIIVQQLYRLGTVMFLHVVTSQCEAKGSDGSVH